MRSRGPIGKLLLPTLQVRFAIAILLTFFPLAILYRVPYPLPDLLALAAWIWAFPSAVGCIAMALLPLVLSSTYGYFVFNLICFGGTLATALAASKSLQNNPDKISKLYKFTRSCMFIVIVICVLQFLSPPEVWYTVFPGMSLAEGGGRGAGFRGEPSLLAGPLSIYVALLVLRIQTLRTGLANPESSGRARRALREGIFVILALLVLTRSISVLAVVVCFVPALIKGRRKLVVPILAAGMGVVVAVLAFGDRIREALRAASGSAADLATVAVGSWRSIPDLIILTNYRDFLLPGNPGEIRTKINNLATTMNPLFAWLENTYSTFAAGATTLGLVATGALFLSGLALGVTRTTGRRAVQATWVLLYLAGWFLTPKYEAAGWIALGAMLCSAVSPNEDLASVSSR
jgi:hypothetical protein